MSALDTIRSNIYYVRAIMAIVSWTGVILRFVVASYKPNEIIIEPFKYFTIQTNIFVATWLTLSVIYKDFRPNMDKEKMEKLYGFIRGGVTSFITLTCVAYWLLLAGTANYDAVENVSSYINHLVIPVYFILDWVLTERSKYSIRYVGKWMIYPLVYLLFDYVFQYITPKNDPIYPFFSIKNNGIGAVLTISLELLVAFLVFCLIYVGLNKLIVKKEGENESPKEAIAVEATH